MKKIYLLWVKVTDADNCTYNDIVVASEKENSIDWLHKQLSCLSMNDALLYMVKNKFKIPQYVSFCYDKNLIKSMEFYVSSTAVI